MNRIVLLLSLTSFAGGASTAYFWHAKAQSEQRTASLQAQVAALEKLTQQTVPRTRDVTASFTVATSPTLPASVTSTPAPTIPPTLEMDEAFLTELGALAMPADQASILGDPEYRTALVENNKLTLAREYPDVGAALELSPDQLDAFLTLLAEQQLPELPATDRSAFPLGNLFGSQSDPAALAEFQRKVAEGRRRKEAAVKSLLGEAKMAQWKNYQASLPAREQVRELRAVLVDAATPLQREQVPALASAIAAEQRKIGPPPVTAQGPPPTRPPDMETLMQQQLEQTMAYNQRLLDATAPHLTAEQSKLFGQMLNQEVEAQRQLMKVIRAQNAAQKRAGITPRSSDVSYELVDLSETSEILDMPAE